MKTPNIPILKINQLIPSKAEKQLRRILKQYDPSSISIDTITITGMLIDKDFEVARIFTFITPIFVEIVRHNRLIKSIKKWELHQSSSLPVKQLFDFYDITECYDLLDNAPLILDEEGADLVPLILDLQKFFLLCEFNQPIEE